MFQTMSQLGDTLKGVVQISEGNVRILHREQATGPLCEQLIQTALHHEQIEMRGTARWMIKSIAAKCGVQLLKHDAQASTPGVHLEKTEQDLLFILFTEAKKHQISSLILSTPTPAPPEKATSFPALSALSLGIALQRDYVGTILMETKPNADSFHINQERLKNPDQLRSDMSKFFTESINKQVQKDELGRGAEKCQNLFRLKDEIALAGLESRHKIHHGLF